MAETLNLGTNGNWATKKESLLAYNSENNNFKPLPFNFTRNSSATRVNKAGLIETVGAGEPRIDFKDNTKGALLLEPTRTNNLLQSNQFDTTWSLSSSISLTSGQSGVGGSTDAWLLKKTDAASRYINQTITLSSSTYSYSVFAKKESGNWLYVRLADSGGSLASTSYFDLENGVVGSTSADSLSIHSYNNGWYRCEVKFTHSIGNVRMYPAVGDGSPSGGSGGEGIYIQHAQLESGSYATSYIPTNGSTVTRVAETCNNAGNEQVFNSSEGVLYAEISALANDGTERRLSLQDNGTYDAVRITFTPTANSLTAVVYNNSVNQFIAVHILNDATTFNKIALKYKQNDFALWVNGIEVATDTNGSVFSEGSLDKLSYELNGIAKVYAKTKDLRVYNTALTDQQLQQLTTI